MAMNRIQFQPGMSLFELFQQFGSETQCEAALEHARWPQGFRCPRCGGAAHCVLRAKARKTGNPPLEFTLPVPAPRACTISSATCGNGVLAKKRARGCGCRCVRCSPRVALRLLEKRSV